MSTTPNDAARPVALYRPVVQKHRHAKAGYIAVMTDKPNPADDENNETLRWVKVTDYDKLREEVERLRLWRFKLCESLGFDCGAGADWTAEEVASAQIKHLTAAAENTARFMRRAEAAEAMNNRCRAVLTELENGIGMANRAGLNVEGSYVVKATGLCVDLLRAALNAQGESNG